MLLPIELEVGPGDVIVENVSSQKACELDINGALINYTGPVNFASLHFGWISYKCEDQNSNVKTAIITNLMMVVKIIGYPTPLPSVWLWP